LLIKVDGSEARVDASTLDRVKEALKASRLAIITLPEDAGMIVNGGFCEGRDEE